MMVGMLAMVVTRMSISPRSVVLGLVASRVMLAVMAFGIMLGVALGIVMEMVIALVMMLW